MKDALKSFAIDLAEGAVAGAAAVIATTNLEVVGAKALAIAVLIGAVHGVISAARRYALARATSAATPAQ